MKGYISYKGYDCSPCFFCKNRAKDVVCSPCYDCIDNSELALHLPNAECEFASFEPISEAHLEVLKYEQSLRSEVGQ